MASVALVVGAALLLVAGLGASPATAAKRVEHLCSAARPAGGALGNTCGSIAGNRGRPPQAARSLLGGQVGGVAEGLGGVAQGGLGPVAGEAVTGALVTAVGLSVLGGAKFALRETAVLLGDTSNPQLGSTWFSSAYWRVAGISVLLTLPFLFAAAVQALLRSDLALLVRAAFGYLPLAMLAVSIAAPVTMLLLAASDQLSAIVASATGGASNRFINLSVGSLAGLTDATGPFMALFLGVLVVAGAAVLWTELLMREAAVYVIVLMLPLAFAAMVWPARRIWAIRAVELLAALVLSKFAIVAVLSLGGAALTSGASAATHSLTAALAGAVLLIMGAFTPWALLRLLPLAEVASSAAGSLSRETRGRVHEGADLAGMVAHSAPDWEAAMTAHLRDNALGTTVGASGATPGPPAASEDSAADGQLAPPQGGPGVTTRDDDKATQPDAAPASETEPVAEDGDGEVQYEVSDVGIDEMWRPEHKGRWPL